MIAPATLEQDRLQQQEQVPQHRTLYTQKFIANLQAASPQAHAESLAEPIRTQHLQVNSVPAYLEARVAAAINTTGKQAAEQPEPQAETQPEISALSFEGGTVKFLMMDQYSTTSLWINGKTTDSANCT